MSKGWGKHMDPYDVVPNAALHLATIPLGTIADVLLSDGTHVNHTRSKTAGAGGIGSMRQGIRCWKG